MSTSMHMYICVRTYVRIHVCMRIYAYVGMYVYVRMCLFRFVWRYGGTYVLTKPQSRKSVDMEVTPPLFKLG